MSVPKENVSGWLGDVSNSAIHEETEPRTLLNSLETRRGSVSFVRSIMRSLAAQNQHEFEVKVGIQRSWIIGVARATCAHDDPASTGRPAIRKFTRFG